MSNELDLKVKLCLHRHDVLHDALFTFDFGAQTEDLYAPAAFINDQSQVVASAQGFNFHWSAIVDVQKLEWIVVALVRNGRCTIFSS